MTPEQMRAAIASVYSSKSWQTKVARMGDTQVFAIYQDFLRTGKFDRKPGKKAPLRPSKKEKHQERQFKAYSGIQLSLFDEV